MKKRIFISYSHKDEEWKEKLMKHLKILELEGQVNLWEDRKLLLGDSLMETISNELNEANIAILLVSSEFLTSDFIRNHELPTILKKFSNKDMLIIPVIIKPCPWRTVGWLKNINAFPKDGNPITSTSNTDYDIEDLFSNFAEIILKILNNTSKRKKPVNLNNYLRKRKKNTLKSTSSPLSTIEITPDGKLQSQKGHHNIQVGRDYIVYESSSPKKINILPPPESIGADTLLKQRIKILFNQIGEQREKRVGKSAYPVLYRKFKSDFGIKGKQEWTIIWSWPKNCSTTILQYLEDKYNNTIKGRIEHARTKENYIPSRPQLYALEQSLLTQLNLDMKSDEIKCCLKNYFGVNSHTMLNQLQHWQFVKYLEEVVKKNIGER